METLSHKKMNLIDTFANSLILSLVLQKMYGDKKIWIWILISGFVVVEPCIHLPPGKTPLLKARQEQCSTNKHLTGWPNYRLAPCLYLCVLGMREDWHQVEEHGVSWEGTSSPHCPPSMYKLKVPKNCIVNGKFEPLKKTPLENSTNIIFATPKILLWMSNIWMNITVRLQRLEEEVISKGVKLIILDSIASLVRKEFDSRVSRNLNERTALLSKEAAILK